MEDYTGVGEVETVVREGERKDYTLLFGTI